MLILNCTGRETHCLVYMLVKLVQRTGMKHLISPDQSVEGMKAVCHELAQATNEPDGSAMDDIVKDADQLVSILANKAIAVTTCVRESCPVLVLTPSSLCLHWASRICAGNMEKSLTQWRLKKLYVRRMAEDLGINRIYATGRMVGVETNMTRSVFGLIKDSMGSDVLRCSLIYDAGQIKTELLLELPREQLLNWIFHCLTELHACLSTLIKY